MPEHGLKRGISRTLDACMSSGPVGVWRSNILVPTHGQEEAQVTVVRMGYGSVPLCLLKSLSQLIMPNPP